MTACESTPLSLEKQVDIAVGYLKEGGIIAFPTETVFGLGADATNSRAIDRIYQVKRRPRDHPLILHLPDLESANYWVKEIPKTAIMLAEAFWPGPLTIILKLADNLTTNFNGNQESVAIRVPSHPVAQSILKRMRRGIVAPSANIFGRLSPTAYEHVFEELGNNLDFVIKCEPSNIGIESTIVDLTQLDPVILRPGQIDQKSLSFVLGREVYLESKTDIRSPGSHPMHYSPATPLTIVYRDDLEKFLHRDACGISVAVLGRSNRPRFSGAAAWQVAPSTSSLYAQKLYSLLRRLDHSGCQLIAVEAPPYEASWVAVYDRLRKSSIPKMALEEYIRNHKLNMSRHG